MKPKGPWSGEQVAAFLRETRVPIRLAGNGSSGHPVLASLWFVPLDGKLWCATQATASVANMFRRDPRCAFEVSVEAPPYLGVRGRGRVTLHDEHGAEILHTLIERYLGSSESRLARFLLSRVEQETALEIEPETLVSWDFTERMGGTR